MVRTIKDRHPHINNRKSRDDPMLHRFDHTFFYSGNILGWNYTAFEFVQKLKTGASAVRFKTKINFTILPLM